MLTRENVSVDNLVMQNINSYNKDKQNCQKSLTNYLRKVIYNVNSIISIKKKWVIGMEERLTWDEIVKKYPEQWVVIKDATMEGSDIVDGIVVAVKNDDEIGEYRSGNVGKSLRFRRTTEGYHIGIIESNFAIEVN